MSAPTAWSKSGLDSLTGGCAWQWGLTKIGGLPSPGSPATARGTGVHAGIEHHERTRILRVRDGASLPLPSEDEVVTVAREAAAVEAAALPDSQWETHGTDLEATLEQVTVAVGHWWSSPIPAGQPGEGASLRDRLQGWRPVAVEPYFRSQLDVSDRSLHGFIDWLGYDHDAGSWVVVDQKTAGGWGRWHVSGRGHELEAATYVVGSRAERSLPAAGDVRMEWHVVRTTAGKTARFEGARCVAMEVDEWHQAHLEDRVVLADRMLAEGRLYKNPAWNLCSAKWCAFHEGCEVSGELAPGGSRVPDALRELTAQAMV